METPVAPEQNTAKRNPWYWVPSLYFAQGVPYVIVMTMSVIMYKRLGISLSDIALYTSLLYLPWVIKPLWSPLVDITRTKRFWTVSMQFLIAGGLALVAASGADERVLQIIARTSFLDHGFCSSATHDIAADGFYMLAMSKHEQAWWVGLRSLNVLSHGDDYGQRFARRAGRYAGKQKRDFVAGRNFRSGENRFSGRGYLESSPRQYCAVLGHKNHHLIARYGNVPGSADFRPGQSPHSPRPKHGIVSKVFIAEEQPVAKKPMSQKGGGRPLCSNLSGNG